MFTNNTPKNSNIFMLIFLIYLPPSQIVVVSLLYLLGIQLNLALLQIIVSIASFMFFFIFYACASKNDFRKILPLNFLKPSSAVLIILISLLLIPLMSLLSVFSMLFAHNDIGDMLNEASLQAGFWVNLLAFAIAPAILEEVLLRGIILNGYKGVKLITAALMNGFFFGLMHLNLQQFLYAFMLGFVFVFLVHYTKSIFAPILAHFTINSISVLSISFMTKEMAEAAREPLSTGELLASISDLINVVIVTLPILLMLFYLFIRINKNDDTPILQERYLNPPITQEEDLMGVSDGLSQEYPEDLPGDHDFDAKNLPPDKQKIFGWEFFAMIAFYIFYFIVFSL